MKVIIVKLAGVSFGDAQENVRRFGCADIGSYALVREPGNQYDQNAIRVEIGGLFMGYVPKKTAKELAPMMDVGRKFIAYFYRRNESRYYPIVGLTVKIVEIDDNEVAKSASV